MLNPNNDRLDFGEILRAPDKYKLDFAIGTTYSLDLDALVGASLALGISEDTDSRLSSNPVALLEALRVTGDKLALFCEAGQIHIPAKITPLYILLEQMVYQIQMNKTRGISAYPSFHPKFWLIRYVNKENQPLYRVVVLSKNLTFDRSWDVSFYMDGAKQEKSTDKTRPIRDFLGYLSKNSRVSSAKKKKIEEICKELEFIHFDVGKKRFDDFEFIPIGIPKHDGGVYDIKDYSLFKSSFDELFIMSPFLSDEIIGNFNNRSRRRNGNASCVLITRAESLTKLRAESSDKFKIYTVKDEVLDGERIISDESVVTQQQDIHAKLYMLRKYPDTELYIGSMNASHNSINGNIEFVVKLKTKNRRLNLNKLLGDLFCGDEDNPNNPFMRVSLADYTDKKTEQKIPLDAFIKDATRLGGKAQIAPNGEHYNVTLSFKNTIDTPCIKIAPLFSENSFPLQKTMVFENLEMSQLSEFYTVTVYDGGNSLSRIIMLPTSGLPEERIKSIVSSVIKDERCFYQYISFLLGDRMSAGFWEVNEAAKEYTASDYRIKILPSLYEKMLHVAATEPEKIKEIESLLNTISKDGIVPEKFEKTYRMFRKAVRYRD